MTSKNRSRFTLEQKRAAIDDFESGRRTAAQVAASLGIAQGVIYKWRTMLAEKAKGARVDELESEGHNPEDARRIMQLEIELELYKQKVAELTIREDLLKKLHGPLYPALKNANGLDEIKRILDQSKRRVK
jgi:transposase-like protein